MSYLLRVVLPDRPGALGSVATALGNVGIDIVSLTVVERTSDGAVDDLLVQLPPDGLADTALTAAHSVPGVTIESLRPFLADGSGVSDDLELADALTDRPFDAPAVLTDLVASVFHADWALLLCWVGPDEVHVREASVGAPDLRRDDLGTPERIRIPMPWLPLAHAGRLDVTEHRFPERWAALNMDLAAAPVGKPELAVLLGRRGGPRFRPSEVARLAYLAGIASTMATGPAS